ncbi:MAG: N-succinylarginine dihydrolase [Phycisphaerae bacterium]|nr:N-succinylarginine dihydrolase [Tepidisphaeraceae bacterium]
MAREVNFDGIVGPTHNYAGLSFGNVASRLHGGSTSHPRKAALEGLAKMQFLASLGVAQAVLPPHLRPDVETLRQLGFDGNDDAAVIARASREAPPLLAACASASAMWAANAATVTASADSADGRVHFTPANLVSTLHRSIEPPVTAHVLRQIFPDVAKFAHHAPLPAALPLGDEGAANHTRLWAHPEGQGVEVYVYGRTDDADAAAPQRFPARQNRRASEAIARSHRVQNAVFVQQHPAAIDAGVFHNDVACVGHRNVLLIHAGAWADQAARLADVRATFARVCGHELIVLEVPPDELSLTEAIDTYLFNSQIVTVGDGSLALIAPAECREHGRAREIVNLIVDGDNPIAAAHFIDVRQSMRNGGGPACLRLRVPLTDDELAAIAPGVFWSESLHARLTTWVEKWYRESLAPAELADSKLLEEARGAQAELEQILQIRPIEY